MGIFWDLIQGNELKKQQKQVDSLEDKVLHLETELEKTKSIAQDKHVQIDIDGNENVG